LEGERKQVTVLCAEIVGYNTLAERLDPEDLLTLVGGCFALLAKEVQRYEGTITQFTNDSLMALFGVSMTYEDHAGRALHAALGIQEVLREYQEEVERGWGVPLQMRLGLHTGTVVIGRIGDNLRMDYTVQGETTHLAARLQQMAPPGAIWVSEATYRVARDAFVWQAVGLMAVPGQPTPVSVYAPLSPREARSRFEVRARQELTRFVGRAPELRRLLEAWERAE
jgi:class 3 adenylate cyclase